MPPASQCTLNDVAHAAEILRHGGLVVFPTETVYGLGAHAFDERAVARVFDVKGRPRFDPLIVHVARLDDLPNLVSDIPAVARKLAEAFWPGPLTLVLPKRPVVPDLVTAGCPTVAVRVPDHPVALELLRTAGVPIVGPSANLFGRVSPTTAAHVHEQFAGKVDLILDGGPCRVGVESTVVQVSADGADVLRPGGVPIEDIESLIGPVALSTQSAGEPTAGLASPGTLPQHYAPRTPLILVSRIDDQPQAADFSLRAPHSALRAVPSVAKVGLLCLRPPTNASRFAAIEILSPAGDLREAAARFFAALRRLDAAGLDVIVAESFPEEGLGRALNDRLRRAAHK